MTGMGVGGVVGRRVRLMCAVVMLLLLMLVMG